MDIVASNLGFQPLCPAQDDHLDAPGRTFGAGFPPIDEDAHHNRSPANQIQNAFCRSVNSSTGPSNLLRSLARRNHHFESASHGLEADEGRRRC